MESWLCQGEYLLQSVKQFLKLAFISSLTLFVCACNYLPANKADPLSKDVSTIESHEESSQANSTENDNVLLASNGVHRQQQQILEMGSGKFIATPRQHTEQFSKSKEGNITLYFQGTDLREFIKVLLNDVLNLSYVIPEEEATKTLIDKYAGGAIVGIQHILPK